MNLDEAIKLSKSVKKAYEDGYISLHSVGVMEIHLNDEKFVELAVDKNVFIESNYIDAYSKHYFIYKEFEFFRLVEREDSNE